MVTSKGTRPPRVAWATCMAMLLATVAKKTSLVSGAWPACWWALLSRLLGCIQRTKSCWTGAHCRLLAVRLHDYMMVFRDQCGIA